MTTILSFIYTFRVLSFFLIPILEFLILSFSFFRIRRSKLIVVFHERNYKKGSIWFSFFFGFFILLISIALKNVYSFLIGLIFSLSVLLPSITSLIEYFNCGIYNSGIIFPRHTIVWNNIGKVFIENDHINVIEKGKGSFYIDPIEVSLETIYNTITTRR